MSSVEDPLDGISGELAGDKWALKTTLVTFIAISCYNVVELVVLVLSTFRRWRGLYFWSLLLSACVGVFLYSLGFMMKFFTSADSTLSVTVLTVGWWAMVEGYGTNPAPRMIRTDASSQSVVLYSRLHLVLHDERILRRVLAMIVVNFFILMVPTTVLTYGSNVVNRNPVFVTGYNIMEKIQMTGFTIQEVIISALYVMETIKMLRLGSDRNKQKIMHQLVGINICIVIMDLALLGLEYASYYAVQITLKGLIYSIKLKLEFAVLGKLVDVVRRSSLPENTMPLCSLQCANGQSPNHEPPALPECELYGVSMTGAVTPPPRSEEEKSESPDEKIFTMTELSTWVERQPHGRAEESIT